MGDEDHLFLNPVRLLVADNPMAALKTITHSGHVCNVDQPEQFNRLAIDFIKNLSGNNNMDYRMDRAAPVRKKQHESL